MGFGALKLCNKYFLTSYKLKRCDVNTLPALYAEAWPVTWSLCEKEELSICQYGFWMPLTYFKTAFELEELQKLVKEYYTVIIRNW